MDRNPDEFMEIFLQPGECFLSDADTRLRTLLGSCVAITMWHPERKVGGMCHYLLPTRGANAEPLLEGRYGDEALFMLLREARQLGCRPRDFHYKIFGGADMFSKLPGSSSRKLARCDGAAIGARNVGQAHDLLADLGVRAISEDVGGQCARAIMLDNWSGDVWVRSTYETEPVRKRDLLLTA